MASGNLGLISFPREPGRVTLEQIESAAPACSTRCARTPASAFVLVRSERRRRGRARPARARTLLRRRRVEGEDPLAPFGPRAADHVRRTDGFAHCPDIVVNSTYWDELDEVAAFEELVGSHGGLGGGQAHPFVLHPADLPWPDEAGRRRGGRAPRCCAAGSRSSAEAYADSSASDSPGASASTRRRRRASARH